MRVFLTGATGFIGSRLVPELIHAGHSVLGLTRSEEGARWLERNGAEAHPGALEAPESVASGASLADAVIHTAFDHDFSRFVENCEKDRRVIDAMSLVLAGSNRPLLITSGTAMGSPGSGQLAVEDVFDRHHPNPRRLSELAGEEAAQRGVSVAVMRLPQVHDTARQGLISPLIEIARQKGVSAYVGEGASRWPAAHVNDVVQLYRLALEGHVSGMRWNAVAEEGVPVREIAEVIGAGLGVPVQSLSADQAAEHFGWLGPFAGMDMPASSTRTRERLNWNPTGPGLIEDLRSMNYDLVTD